MAAHLTIMETTLDSLTPSSTHGISSSTLERALTLLGAGVSVESTASACGVSASRISQLLSVDSFKAAVSELRYNELQKHNKQDSEYDSIETVLTEKFKQAIPLMMRPMEILKGLQVINAQKRRGTTQAGASSEDKQTIVSIALPSVIVNNFTEVTTNIHNQVVKIGEKDLTTMQSNTLLNQLNLQNSQKDITNVTLPGTPFIKHRKRDNTDI